MNCAGFSYCQIIGWSLTMNFFWDPSEIFKLLGMIETLFTNLWSCGCCLHRRWWWWINSPGSWQKDLLLSSLKKMQLSIISLFVFRTGKHVLDTDSWNHSDVATKDLWRRFSWRFNGWSRSWFKIMLWWSWGPFIHFVKRSSWFFCVMKLKFCKCWICLRGNC